MPLLWVQFLCNGNLGVGLHTDENSMWLPLLLSFNVEDMTDVDSLFRELVCCLSITSTESFAYTKVFVII